MSDYALRLANGADTAQRVRLGDAFGVFPAGDIKGRSGVRAKGGAVTVSTGTMSVQVAPFSAFIDGTSSGTQGGYTFVSDATKSLTIGDGHATLARVDTIVARVQDDVYDGGGVTQAQVSVIAGTPGGGAPALPPSCVPLRDINVPAGLSAGTGGLASSNLGTDRRVVTVSAGGLLPVSGVTERDGLTPYNGMAVYRKDSDQVQVFNGTGWQTFNNANDTGWTNSTMVSLGNGLGFVGGPGLSRMRKIGNRVTLDLAGIASEDIGVPSGGNISDRDIDQLPVGFRPTQDQHVMLGATKAMGAAVVKPSGIITLRTITAPGINQFDAIWLNCTYLTD